MVGVIIGSGIFRTPPQIASELGSPWLILLMWLLGGLLCLAGAFTYAELAAMYPQSGGVYVFIREGFGGCPAFVFGWSYLLLVKPFAAAGIAFVFGEHVNILATTIVRAFGATGVTINWDPRIATTVMLVALTWVNVRGVRLSTDFAGVLTFLKVAALAAIVLLALLLSKADAGRLATGTAPQNKPLLNALVAAMSAILWTYDGWADVGSIAGEVKEPQRVLPRIYLVGTGGIILLYLAVNAVYFMLVPLPELRALYAQNEGVSIAPLVMERLIGPAGSTVVVLIVLVSTLGSTHASIMTGARVSYAQARDGLLFRFIGHVHPRYATPDTSLISQVVLSVIAVWCLGSFQALADNFIFTMWIFYAMAAASIIIFRIRRPDVPRPFRCPGYPVMPLVFLLAAVAMTGLSIHADPWGTLPWVGVLLAGVPVFYVWRRLTKPTPADDAG